MTKRELIEALEALECPDDMLVAFIDADDYSYTVLAEVVELHEVGFDPHYGLSGGDYYAGYYDNRPDIAAQVTGRQTVVRLS